ncbi:hypothetical protein HY991_04130, partial [Candidatus Micrarchaeota archaeon]|nr:hypothetical protein [Candidatus Micrarchaeota archaeon]
MPVKDGIVSWFIRNVLLPHWEIIDTPGFVSAPSMGARNVLIRDVFVPETVISNFERDMVSKYGNKAMQTLYSIGKKFGYGYASIASFNHVGASSRRDLGLFAYFLVRYIGSIYASDADYQMDLDKKLFRISFDNYVVCRNNGIGLLFGSGGIAGIWAYIVGDKRVEGVKLQCQGRGD